jgi:tRNA modification GTPase
MNVPARSAFAVLTPPGRGGIAVVRCVGPSTRHAIETCFRPAGVSRKCVPRGTAKKGSDPNTDKGSDPFFADPFSVGALAYGHIVDAGGLPLDEIILCRAAEETFEVNCHGGPAAVRAVSDRLAELGLEEVDPDTLLALEGVPRLSREARAALRSVWTPLAARILLDQLNGALAQALGEVRARLKAGGGVEAAGLLDELLGRWHSCGRFLAEPPRLVIAGRPNAGKSTLLNRLAGSERAVTSAVPGTTRDTVEAPAALDGVPVLVVDTAGLRDAAGGVEREGIDRARREIDRADLIVYLVDATVGLTGDDAATLRRLGPKGLAVWNKADAVPAPAGALVISALRGDGCAGLVAATLERLGWRAPEPGEGVPFTREHAERLEAARASAPSCAETALAALEPLH